MIYRILLIISLISVIHAQELDETNLLELLQGDMQKYSDIATETKQNVDYMPYVVSVLKNEELVQLGILSLREALSLVPGVDIAVGVVGSKDPVFRGSNPLAMGQSKLIIDGIVVNEQLLGTYNEYLDMPIDIIERIEVVRGPGSLLDHVNAYAGSIHVITKAGNQNKTDNAVFASFGSDEYKMGGYVASFQADKLKLSSDFFYQRHDKSVYVDRDKLGQSGTADNALKNYALAVNAQYESLSLKSRFNKNENGVSYGQDSTLSEDSSDFVEISSSYVEVAYGFELASRIKAKASIEYFEENRELKNKVRSNSAGLPNGKYLLIDYKENKFTERFEIEFENFEDHVITAGVQFSQANVKNNTARNSTDGLQTFTLQDLVSIDNRKHFSAYANDLININEKNSLQIGLKFDQFSDVADQFSPRVAFVHRYDDDNIFKLMYTHSFREPSWREEYHFKSSPVDEETVDAYEAAYIHLLSSTESLKFNLFFLDNKDQIHSQNSTSTFKNSGDGKLYGGEVELKTEFNDNEKFYLNYSYVDGDNVSGSLANTAQHIAKAYYIHSFDESLSLSGLVKYVGEKERVAGDTRSKVDDYATVDLTTVYTHKSSGVRLSASVKNIFDTTYHLPSANGTYPDDYEQEGINFLVRLEKRF